MWTYKYILQAIKLNYNYWNNAISETIKGSVALITFFDCEVLPKHYVYFTLYLLVLFISIIISITSEVLTLCRQRLTKTPSAESIEVIYGHKKGKLYSDD